MPLARVYSLPAYTHSVGAAPVSEIILLQVIFSVGKSPSGDVFLFARFLKQIQEHQIKSLLVELATLVEGTGGRVWSWSDLRWANGRFG